MASFQVDGIKMNDEWMKTERTALGLLNVLDRLRADELCDDELLIQIEVFERQRQNDDERLDLRQDRPFFDQLALLVDRLKVTPHLLSLQQLHADLLRIVDLPLVDRLWNILGQVPQPLGSVFVSQKSNRNSIVIG